MHKIFYPSGLEVFKYSKYIFYVCSLICLMCFYYFYSEYILKDKSIYYDRDSYLFVYFALPGWLLACVLYFLILKKISYKILFENNELITYNGWGEVLNKARSQDVEKIEFKNTRITDWAEKKNKKKFFLKDLWIHLSNNQIIKVPWQMGNFIVFIKQLEDWSGVKLPKDYIEWLEDYRGNEEYSYDSAPTLKNGKKK